MNAYTAVSILNTLSPLLLGIFTLRKANRQSYRILWAQLCFLTFFWGLGGFIATITKSKEIAYLGWQIANLCSIYCSPLFYHFMVRHLNHKGHISIVTPYLLATFFFALNIFKRESFLGSLQFVYNEYYYISFNPNENPVYIVFYVLFFWLLLGYSFYLLIKYHNKATAEARNKFKFMVLASGIAWIGAHQGFVSVFFPRIYPYLNFLLSIFPIIITYAVIKHQLFDIQLILRKSVVYSSLVAVITIIYFGSVLLVEKAFQGLIGYNSFLTSLAAAILITASFIPLRNKIQSVVDKFLLKGTPAEIAEENEYLRKEVAQAEKMKAVATLASGMAHEIRNPLTVIQTFFDQLPAKKDNPEFMRQLNTLVGKEVNRINDLVSQLLEFSKPSPLSVQETDIRKLIEDCLNLLGGQLAKHNIQAVKNFNADRHIFKADANKLKQVFLNLFMNAIDAMPEGGTLTISAQLPKASAKGARLPDGQGSASGGDSCLLIAVQDTGCGISTEDLKHIFEPFFTKKEKGTGLGLAVCKNIIEEHGGKITATSTVGQGTVFILKFSQGLKKDAN